MSRTVAGNPGKLKVNRWRLYWSEPVWPVILITSGVSLLALSLLDRSPALPVLGGLCIGFAGFGSGRHVRQFEEGDVNISKILSLDPPLFATSTNMQNSWDAKPYPVVKIVRRKVPGMRGVRWKVGDYFPAACFYAGSMKRDHWVDVFPLPVSMATDRVEAVDMQMSRIDHLRGELDRRLKLVPRPYRPGLYFLDNEKLSTMPPDDSSHPSDAGA